MPDFKPGRTVFGKRVEPNTGITWDCKHGHHEECIGRGQEGAYGSYRCVCPCHRKTEHNPQHEVHDRLKRAIREKHGPWADEAERLFKRLRVLHKELTDAQIMEMVRAEMKKHSKIALGFPTAEQMDEAVRLVKTKKADGS